jgi:PadR family transcriptional regulator PadR
MYYHHNVKVIMLGEFEYLLITAAVRLGEDAYGAAIRHEIEAATRRHCSIGALYTTLDRLEAKGLLDTWMGNATPQRGGRAKRMVRVTATGKRAAKTFYAAVTRVTQDVSWATKRPRSQP